MTVGFPDRRLKDVFVVSHVHSEVQAVLQDMKPSGLGKGMLLACDSLLIWFTHGISPLLLLTFSPKDVTTRQGDSALMSTKTGSFLNEIVVCLFWPTSNILLLMLESRHYIIQL